MPVKTLDHVNLRTDRLDEMRRFYTEVLNMEAGPRPPFSFDGAWMYCGGKPIVHLVGVARAPSRAELSLEHFALAGEDLTGFAAHLRDAGVSYKVVVLPEYGDTQLHIRDPDGNHIHVDFSADEPGTVEDFTP